MMSPHNIIQMAKLNSIDILAVTDHNTCANCKVMMEVGESLGVLVIPGMEIECSEEFHCIALFPTLEAAYTIEKLVKDHLPPLLNKPEIFGEQCIFDETSEVVGYLTHLLLTATDLNVEVLYEAVWQVGGVLYPAHIDRNSYSILSNLGNLPRTPTFNCLEISQDADINLYRKLYPDHRILKSSDAHYIESLCHMREQLSLPELSRESVLMFLREK
jgi:hypothetical protein